MIILPAAIGSFLLVNLVCACIALGVGFGAGVWFFGAKMAKPAALPASAKKKAPNLEKLAAKRAAERAAMATSRVADLAQGVASDVGEHAAKMKEISAGLASVDREASGTNAAVLGAMDKILAANSELQHRLEAAEKQLAVQAAEIKAHESEARTDSLTGLSNRRAFDDELKRRLSEFERKGTPVTLILLDIDFFKKFNDTHGHQVGDEVLRVVAKTLRSHARDMDLPCRYGGEEFAAILPATDAAGACIVAERIRTAVEDSVTACDGKSLKVTCSLGLSQAKTGDDSPKIIRRADDALYKSKEAGRNCGHWTDGETFFPITRPPASSPSPPAIPEPVVSTEPVETVLPPRPTFVDLLKRRVTESHRFGIPLSLMILKVEEYQAIFKSDGRAVARQILDLAEPALEEALREMDALVRMENGEFIVMLPGKTQAEAAQVLKRMRVATSQCVVPLKEREYDLRFQHGIAELKPNETAQEVLARARQGFSGPAATVATAGTKNRPARAK
jgi:diguanylate cyclase